MSSSFFSDVVDDGEQVADAADVGLELAEHECAGGATTCVAVLNAIPTDHASIHRVLCSGH